MQGKQFERSMFGDRTRGPADRASFLSEYAPYPMNMAPYVTPDRSRPGDEDPTALQLTKGARAGAFLLLAVIAAALITITAPNEEPAPAQPMSSAAKAE
jgi:hypothetical protein